MEILNIKFSRVPLLRVRRFVEWTIREWKLKKIFFGQIKIIYTLVKVFLCSFTDFKDNLMSIIFVSAVGTQYSYLNFLFGYFTVTFLIFRLIFYLTIHLMFGNQNVKNMDVPVIDEEVARYEKIKKEMCCLFNEITPSYKELSDQFFAFNFIEDYKLLAEIVDLIFEKVIEEPHLSDLFSDLCKKKVDVERQMQLERDKLDKHLDNQTKKVGGNKDFQVITKAQQHWNIFDDYNNKIKQLEEELKNADDKSRLVIEKEIETRRSEEKRRFFGIIKFTGQLYRNSLINEDIIDWCSLELVRQFETTEDEVYLEYAVEFIKAVGKIYDGFHLDIVMDYLSRLKPRVSNRVHSLITDLEDLKKNCWTPRIFTTL
uniref:MIF4G domain-containing protein n=1 Tax=Meloidogyne enterolobii TaxID=390850 RepID=A0A6V7WB32_MELEN|nr:unnamed protein product [Meloidogyne enterolobii]